ncbi:MAG TPA: Maf family protein [Gammaproteobacteria bacterium]|nr:Maf family protein [Gammaproteobacteria bacterium]
MTKDFIYLASASPRRSALLDQIGVPYRVLAPAVSEARRDGESPEAYVARVAAEKADRVWERIAAGESAPVLAADTAVVVDGEVFGKPADAAEALGMLERLSGRSHTVLTALALRWQSDRDGVVASSEVRFRATTAAERKAYCLSGEPFDKAGAYAIQGLGALFVEHLSGSHSAVMGLPLCETARLLGRYGLPAWLASGAVPG